MAARARRRRRLARSALAAYRRRIGAQPVEHRRARRSGGKRMLLTGDARGDKILDRVSSSWAR